VIGEGYLRNTVKKSAGKTIQFLGYVSEQRLTQVIIGAKALLFCATNEDFGLTPVEAMARGVPVIAYNHGATRETVIQGKTGIFFHTYTKEALFEAIKKLEVSKMNPEACHKQAQRFNETRFIKSIKKIV
jgi:glycosyltransferase involved in cell wall biosynthesis